MQNSFFRRGVAALAAAALAGSLAACAESKRDTGSGSGEKSSGANDTFIFAGASDPVMLDPSFASDGETFRITRQIFEGLVGAKPGTTELKPALAEKWSASQDGKEFTFTLKQGVKFHDGADFNADAVCANFDRWANWKGLNQNENISYYYNSLFQGFKAPEGGAKPGIYDSCQAKSASEVTVKLNKPFAAFFDAMTLPAFAMQSPKSLKEFNADNTSGTAKDPRFSEYATAHPAGTGPFKFEKWDRGQQVVLTRNDNYWGDKAKVSKAIVRIIPDAKARTQELQAGNVDGYDLVAPADIKPLKDKGFQVMPRPPFDILYLAFNQDNPALKDPRVRQAINYAIDKEAVAKQTLPEGTKTAVNWMPDNVVGYNANVNAYKFDQAKAKQLLQEAGQTNLTLRFAYPTGVSRPYMPSPEDTYVALKSQLEAVGIKVQPVTSKWSPDYLDMTRTKDGAAKRDLHLLGWTGDYNDPDNFLGVKFGKRSTEFNFDNPDLFSQLQSARELSTKDQQKAAYEKVATTIADFAPGVPLAHPAPSLALGKGVKGYEPSPINDEVWSKISVTR